MTDAERLRRAILDSARVALLDNIDNASTDFEGTICRALVKEFGLGDEPPEGGSSWGHWRDDCMDLVQAIIDVAEGK